MTSPVPTGRQSDGDVQQRQQAEIESLQQQLQQLCTEIEQLTTDMKHMSVTHTQVKTTYWTQHNVVELM